MYSPSKTSFVSVIIAVLFTLISGLPVISFGHGSDQLPNAIERTRDAVVKLYVRKSSVDDNLPEGVSSSTRNRLRDLNQYFEQAFPDMKERPRSRAKLVGSGLILDQNGLIVSSSHLLKGASDIKVEMANGQKFRARIIGKDTGNDIGLLQVELDKPVNIPLHMRGADVRAGQSVYVIGAPFGFSGSVATGIVSATRSHSKFLRETPLIQTDVAINPGNSGGPLFNYAGEVMGIISNIMSTNGGSQGVSFAVSIDAVMQSVRLILRQTDRQLQHD